MPAIPQRLAFLTLVAAVYGSPLTAQRESITADASIGLSGGLQRSAVSGWYPVAEVWQRVTFAIGLRATSYTGDGRTYTNRGTVSDSVPSTLSLSTGVLGVNLGVQAKVRLIDRVSVGFNLDVAGFATGASNTTGRLTASVQSGSLFLGGAGDLGALNSETFVAVRLTDRIALRGGTSHFVTNYLVRQPSKVATPDVRYQKFETVPFLAIAVRF